MGRPLPPTPWPSQAAFPTLAEANGKEAVGSDGLSKRELLAAMAMQGLLACPTSPGNADVLAQDAVKHADALLSELAKG